MPIFGKAIAKYLCNLSGLYSVELPLEVWDEIVEIVQICNENEPMRALLVTQRDDIEVAKTSWDELLQWRTSDDRVFVWVRGAREPDSSFQSAVKPFITSRFPGVPTGECTLELLATISIKELWEQNGIEPIGDVFEAFLQTSKWVLELLRISYEQAGSSPSAHWSDLFLVHWAKLLEMINNTFSQVVDLTTSLRIHHAWEIIRLAGYPVPAELSRQGNPYLDIPDEIGIRGRKTFAKWWQQVTEDFLLTEQDRAILLTALDWVSRDVEKTSSWRGLDWDNMLDPNRQDILIAPMIVQNIFDGPSSPSLLEVDVPAYPVSQKPSWWGVTEADIRRALDNLKDVTFFRPSTSCQVLQGIENLSGIYWVRTRKGRVYNASTSRCWKASVILENLEVEFKEKWERLVLSRSLPRRCSDGQAWVDPDSVKISIKGGRGVKVTGQPTVATLSGTMLKMSFNLEVEYSAQYDVDEVAIGDWKPERTLQIELAIQNCLDGKWVSARDASASIKLLIPSPFSPTICIIPLRGKPVVVPTNGDKYVTTLIQSKTWDSVETPDLILKEEGNFFVNVLDGRVDTSALEFSPIAEIIAKGDVLQANISTEELFEGGLDLDDGDIISAQSSGYTADVAVVKVSQRSSNLSSGLMSAVRGQRAGQRAPSQLAKSTLLGNYQVQISDTLHNPPGENPNSLYQYVLPTNDMVTVWPKHRGTPDPEFLPGLPDGFLLPGIGNGPDSELVTCPEWSIFMDALEKICKEIGIGPGKESIWLSGFDPSIISGTVIKTYVDAHRDLVEVAKLIGDSSTFWASYPFSIMIVDGIPGASIGQLRAVFLSLLHPARLAWAFSVAFMARHVVRAGTMLVGFAEGWNIPCVGRTVGTVGQNIPMVAIPIDPGDEQDFITWSALAVLDQEGLAKLPDFAAGLPLPWGGQTGINHKVVERSIKDYLQVHPHLNTLEVDLRSITASPRSSEIDNAVLKIVGGTGFMDEVDGLGGGTRVQSSAYRLGSDPTRDDLLVVRKDDEYHRPFEWIRYEASKVPTSADIAFIENSSIHLGIGPGSTNGVIGYLPLKRFNPSFLNGDELEQNYSASPNDDLLGLASLLASIEIGTVGTPFALKARPQAHALGVGMGARWEIIGTFNIDPGLLSSVVANQAQSLGKRLLWEWRPSWLGYGSKVADISRRPYYVVGKIPPSLLMALELRHALTPDQAFDMLLELGRRGIGINSLQSAGGTQESAALGFFYALRLLLPPPEHPLQAEWNQQDNDGQIFSVLPLDPIKPILEEMASDRMRRCADLLAVKITKDSIPRVCFVPIEVKHHGREGEPEQWPGENDPELKRAREQLVCTAQTIDKIITSILLGDGENSPVKRYALLVGMATLLELAMNLSTQPPSANEQARILKNILSGQVAFSVGNSILTWFAPGSVTIHGSLSRAFEVTSKEYPLEELYIDPSATRGLWGETQAISANDKEVREIFDEVLNHALLGCENGSSVASGIRDELASLLGVSAEDEVQQDAIPSRKEDPSDEKEIKPGREDLSVDEATKVDHIHTEKVGRQDLEDVSDSSITEHDSAREEHEDLTQISPRIIVGWTTPATRWNIIGKMIGTSEVVALDLDHPKAIGIFGYMGSGKSYLLGTMVEAALEPMPGLNLLPEQLAVAIFNYRRNASDRFELSSLGYPNSNSQDISNLEKEFGATPKAIKDIKILCLPGELTEGRQEEYNGLPASELFFNPETLSVDDWELLMGDPGSKAVFARTIRHGLRELRSTGDISLGQLESYVSGRLRGQSRTAAQLRLEFVSQYLSEEHGIDFENLLSPGRVVIFDLRQPLFSKDDALRFFLVCSNFVSRVQGQFNKLVVFDEAHEYLSDAFAEQIDARIRLMRHEGTSYVFATQDVGSIPLAIRRFLTTRFVFNLGTRENIEDLIRSSPAFEGYDLMRMEPGKCLVQANESVNGIFSRPRLIQVRPRVTQHGGASRIFSKAQIRENED